MAAFCDRCYRMRGLAMPCPLPATSPGYLRVHRPCCSVATSIREEHVQLTIYISSAADGLFNVTAVEVPELASRARTLEDIPGTVRSAAAALTGQPPEDFDIVMDF